MKKIFALMAAAFCMFYCTAAQSAVVYVTPNGNDANSGASWELAKRTIQAAVDKAAIGDEIWVAKGVYSEDVTLNDDVSLYGGFAGNETELSQRDWKANPTIFDNSKTRYARIAHQYSVLLPRIKLRIDGFTFQNLSMPVSIDNSELTTYTNNVARNCNYGVAITGGALVYNNVFTNNWMAIDIYGKYVDENCDIYSATIKNNIVTDNNYGIYCRRCYASIYNNFCSRNTNGGILLEINTSTVANNVITGNYSQTGEAGGIGCAQNSQVNIINNTIIDNASRNGGGIYYDGSSTGTVANNIVAYNSSGIYAAGPIPTLKNNCFYNPDGSNYIRATKGATDINVDPKLAAAEYGEVHLQAGSPCIDKGDDTAVVPEVMDMDGQARISNHVDMGADESYGEPRSFAPAIVRVSPLGNDANDGSSWQQAKKTIQAAVDTVYVHGGEVWVAAGTYPENIKARPFVYLYGGFDGSEASKEQRNWSKNKSIIGANAAQSGALLGVVICAGHKITCVDGFTIMNCKTNDGTQTDNYGAIYCDSASIIANNTIIDNAPKNYGVGIYSNSSANFITGNTITGTLCSVYCQNTNSTITNNTLAYNGSGISISVGTSKISNNVIAFNSGAGIDNYYGTCTLRNNCVYQNGINYSGVAGPNDKKVDPQFVDATAGDYHLLPTSPCINAGLNTAANIPALDMDCENRVCWGVVDIGADEFNESAPNIAFAKQSIDGAVVSGYAAIVSAVFDDCFYITTDDRYAGIRIVKPGNSIKAGTRVDYAGVVKTTSDGERYIEASSLTARGTGSVEPFDMINKSLGGCDYCFDPLTGAGQRGVEDGIGPNNIGLLIKSTGRVSVSSDGYFYFDDGTHAQDGSIFSGVRVKWSGVKPAAGENVAVTGISAIMNISGKYYRCIRALSIQGLN